MRRKKNGNIIRIRMLLFMQLLLTAYLTCGCGKNDEIHVVQIWESGGAGQGKRSG